MSSKAKSDNVVLNEGDVSNRRQALVPHGPSSSIVKSRGKGKVATAVPKLNLLKKSMSEEVKDSHYPTSTPISKAFKTDSSTSLPRSSIGNTKLKSSPHAAKPTGSLHTSKSNSNNVKKIDTVKRAAGRNEISEHRKDRGKGAIYMPISHTNKLDTKTTNASVLPMRGKESTKKMKSSGNKALQIGSAEHKNSKTLGPNKVKVLHSSASGSHVLGISKRVNVAGEGKEERRNSDKNRESEDDYCYEDDFEDYESDFQECTDSDVSQIIEELDAGKHSPMEEDPIELSTQQAHSMESKKMYRTETSLKVEEESMLDSGHYELTEARKRAAKIGSVVATASPLELSRLTNNRSHMLVTTKIRSDRSTESGSLPLSMDEGFEDDSRSGDFIKSPPLSKISTIGFHKSKDASSSLRNIHKHPSRGEQLMEMIKLDTVDITLLECAPIPYEEFIRSYGRLNTRQIATQTSEDNVDCEVQTEDILSVNKWTQFPIQCRKVLRTKEDIQLFQIEHIGVGGDINETAVETATEPRRPSFDILRLNDFLSRAGKTVLSLLEQRKTGGHILQRDTHGLPFSEGFVKLSINSIPFLSGRPVVMVHCSEVSNKVLLTIHSPAIDEGIETSNRLDYITDSCIGCVWDIFEPSMPRKIFYSHSRITACCFHPTNYNVVFAGLEDGSISLWDLKEDEAWHRKINDRSNGSSWIIRACTYSTSAHADTGFFHNSKVVSIQVLSKLNEIQPVNSIARNDLVAIQICSLDEEGQVLVWSAVRNIGNAVGDVGLAKWGNIRLVQSQQMFLCSITTKDQNNISRYVDMNVDSMDNNSLYVATNTSNILHVTCIGNKTNPLMYKHNEIDPCGSTTCIKTCPFERSYFLVGCDDGTIRLHTLNAERPLLQLKDHNRARKITDLQWSKSRPFIIYALDNSSRIYVWDLDKSEVNPAYTFPICDWSHVSCMQLSTCKSEHDMAHQYLALASLSGDVRVHKLKTDFCCFKKADFLEELAMFTQYLSIS